MDHWRVFLIVLLLSLAGCAAHTAGSSIEHGQLDVFGIAIYSSTDYREISGVRGVDEPCLRGVERSFEALDVVIGYDRGGRIRKITTRNPATAMFGIHPGEAVVSALEKVRQAGFAAGDSSYRFRKGELALALLTDGRGVLFGVTLEAVEPAE